MWCPLSNQPAKEFFIFSKDKLLVILSSSVYLVRHRFEKSRVSQEDFQKIEGEWNAYLTAGKEHIKLRLSQDALLALLEIIKKTDSQVTHV